MKIKSAKLHALRVLAPMRLTHRIPHPLLHAFTLINKCFVHPFLVLRCIVSIGR